MSEAWLVRDLQDRVLVPDWGSFIFCVTALPLETAWFVYSTSVRECGDKTTTFHNSFSNVGRQRISDKSANQQKETKVCIQRQHKPGNQRHWIRKHTNDTDLWFLQSQNIIFLGFPMQKQNSTVSRSRQSIYGEILNNQPISKFHSQNDIIKLSMIRYHEHKYPACLSQYFLMSIYVTLTQT